MSIIIKGIEMPTCCDKCFALDDHGDYPYCLISHDQMGYTFRTDIMTMPSCPIGEVPTPHGRLIDADALADVIESIDWYHQAPNKEMVGGANSNEHQAWYKEQDIFAAVDDAPTIIEAEDV